MWLLGRLAPDHKTIAEFRRMHREGVTAAGAELVRLARSVGLVKGAWVAMDGSKFQAVSSVKSVREREALERYLEQLEQRDEQDEVVIDPSAVASALEKLHRHPEPEVAFRRTTHGFIPAYNVQAAVDAEHALIVAQQGTFRPATTAACSRWRKPHRQRRAGLRSRSTWLPMRVTRMDSRPKPARLRASCRMCLRTVA
jgi:hypothetical protein